MHISYVPTPTDRVRDVLLRDIPSHYVRIYENRVFYSASTGIPKGEGRTLDAEKKKVLIERHLQEITARLNRECVPTPSEPDPQIYLSTQPEHRNDLYSFYYWTRKSKDLKGIKKAFSIANTPSLSTEYSCECCGHEFHLQFGKVGYTCFTPCPSCGHDGTEGCLCALCTQHTDTLKQNIHDLLESVEQVIQHSWEQLIESLKDAASSQVKPPSDAELYLLSAKYRTSSLTSDERCFLHHYKEMKDKGIEAKVLEVLNNAPLKNLGKALEDLVNHGVLISQHLPITPNMIDVVSRVQKELFPDIHIDCDFQGWRMWFQKWESSVDDVVKVRRIEIFSDQHTLFERIKSRALQVLRRTGPKEYRVNPFYLEPLSLPRKGHENKWAGEKSAGALTSVFKSPQESAIFESLRDEHPGKIILPNCPVASLIDFTKLPDTFSGNEVSQIRRMIFDFVICDTSGYPLCAIECQHGKHHNAPVYIEKDYLKMKLCAVAGIEHCEIHGRFDAQILT